MICDLCKDGEAVIQLTEIEGSGVRQLHLCEKCAAERGVETTVDRGQAADQRFSPDASRADAAAKGEPAQCTFCSGDACGFPRDRPARLRALLRDVRDSLRDLLRRVHGNSRHIGRRYVAPLPTELPHVSSATELRDRLERAIEAEQFELAADMRDKLRGIE